MANRRSIVSLQQLPIDALTMIVEKVGNASSADYCNARATCKKNERSLQQSYNPPFFLSLTAGEEASPYDFHMEILEKCVDQENYSGYFIRGIFSYFIEDDPKNRMAFLQLAAIGDGADLILEAAYFYGMLRLLQGDPGEGEEHMAKMNWRDDDDLKTTNEVWKKLRKSLHGITIRKKEVYVQSLQNMMPPESYHLCNLETACLYCFHYKWALKFYRMIP